MHKNKPDAQAIAAVDLIINQLYICKQKKVARNFRVVLLLTFIATLITLAVSGVQAQESSVEKTSDFSRDKILGKERTKIKNNSQNAKFQEIVENYMGKSGSTNSLDREPSPKEIERSAERASEMTGVRKEFLMGMLVIESDLGRNMGKCTYEEIEKDARKSYERGLLSRRSWGTFRRRSEIIKNVAKDTRRDYRKLKVSCNPPSYVGTGGAMGIPQFMPDTWMEYRSRLSELLGKDNPNPWDIDDGVMAMALKLSDVPGVTDHDYWSEMRASKLYLSGTSSSRYNWYANSAQYWSRNYGKLKG